MVDAWRKVHRLQFPWQTNVFSAPLNSSFSRSAANSTFHDPSVRDRRKRLVACKAAFSASARKKGYPYRISMERKVRDGRVESSDRVPKTERAIQGNRFIQSHRRSSANSSLIYSVSELNFRQVLTECGYFVVEVWKISSLFVSQI